MALVTISSQFSQVLIGTASNTALGSLTDLTTWAQGKSVSVSNDPADFTVYAASGGPVTKTVWRGILTAQVKVTFLYDTAAGGPWRILRQLVGSRSGFPIRLLTGTNAIPASGDEQFLMSATLLGIDWDYSFSTPSTFTCTFDPVDAGTYAPEHNQW